MLSLEECCTLFSRNGQKEKVNLLKSIGRFNYNVYFLDGKADTFYGPLITSTGLLDIFNLIGFNTVSACSILWTATLEGYSR